MFKGESFLKEWYHNHVSKYKEASFSQEGEDRVLSRIFGDQKDGYYIDVGAHHPFRFSNTYLFYLRGWSGINIDANPDCISLFRKFRPRDVNINSGVGLSEASLTFYKFYEPALNSFDRGLSLVREKAGWKMDSEIQVRLRPLKDILEENIKEKKAIDYLSIDVEGFDFQVLQSNDWDKFRPRFVLVECLNTIGANLDKTDVYDFLIKNNYEFYAKTFNTSFFKDRSVK